MKILICLIIIYLPFNIAGSYLQSDVNQTKGFHYAKLI